MEATALGKPLFLNLMVFLVRYLLPDGQGTNRGWLRSVLMDLAFLCRVVVAESNSHNPLGCLDHPELGPPVFPALQRFMRSCGGRPTSLVCLESRAAYVSFYLLHSWESLTVRAA